MQCEIGLERVKQIAEGGVWHFGFLVSPPWEKATQVPSSSRVD